MTCCDSNHCINHPFLETVVFLGEVVAAADEFLLVAVFSGCGDLFEITLLVWGTIICFSCTLYGYAMLAFE